MRNASEGNFSENSHQPQSSKNKESNTNKNTCQK
jgi:hypothetical protein